jgi:hypothetical protein
MATATTTLVSALYADDTKWIEAAPAYDSILNVIGPATNANAATCKTAILNLAQRSPITVAFILKGDPDHIQVGHTLSPFSNDPFEPLLTMTMSSSSWEMTSLPLLQFSSPTIPSLAPPN